ncbi:hypothetical protein C436_05445 [Haloarcula marismortui ATCC 33800]|uniref:Uncharacterized protein n=1 Tax=Haloarcula marismortui ATCC 33800 TaxID=662476 RepID=M0K4X6_9EURY|nr:hypothetical protein C436_05445 [Haloarcula sinaiiensis ATCC 33800]
MPHRQRDIDYFVLWAAVIGYLETIQGFFLGFVSLFCNIPVLLVCVPVDPVVPPNLIFKLLLKTGFLDF